MTKATAKSTITHPVSRREMKIDTETHRRFEDAILRSLRGSPGKTFTQLTDDVVKTIRKEWPQFKGSIQWYTISVRLDLESRGVVETFTEKGKKWNRLRSMARKR